MYQERLRSIDVAGGCCLVQGRSAGQIVRVDVRAGRQKDIDHVPPLHGTVLQGRVSKPVPQARIGTVLHQPSNHVHMHCSGGFVEYRPFPLHPAERGVGKGRTSPKQCCCSIDQP